MTQDFREQDLIVNEDVDEYDGTTAVVRTEQLTADEIEFMRWRAERWMKVRHMPGGARARSRVRRDELPPHDAPHVPRLDAQDVAGLESEREAFRRYKAIRRAEREFFPDISANASPGPTIRRQASTGKPSELVAQQTSPGRRISV